MDPQSSLQLALDIHWALVGLRAFPPAGGFVCSLSIMVALAMLMNGAGIGTPTHLELLRYLTAPDLQEHPAPTLSSPFNASAAEIQYNQYINTITKSLRRHTNKPGTALVLDNAVWSKKEAGGITLFRPWYVRRVQGWFQAPATTVDDVAPINAWAANVTHGLITEAVPPNLRFLLVLTNAVYFNGQWQYVFDKNLTKKAAFTTFTGVKQVNTMTLYVPPLKQHQRPVAVASKPGVYTAIKLPYRNSTLSAVVILPDEAAFGVDVYAAMPQLQLRELLHNMSQMFKPVMPGFMLKLPKFDLRSGAMSLVKVLQASSISVSFTPAAQFSRMSADSPLYVTEVLHSVAVIVNEQGTEAAAVTAVVLDRGDHGRLIVNRPFVFAAVDEAPPDAYGSAPTVLFFGAVVDPG